MGRTINRSFCEFHQDIALKPRCVDLVIQHRGREDSTKDFIEYKHRIFERLYPSREVIYVCPECSYAVKWRWVKT